MNLWYEKHEDTSHCMNFFIANKCVFI